MKRTVPIPELKANDTGHKFPYLNCELLSWSIGLYHTHEQQQNNYPKMRTVIRAMMVYRPAQLENERREMLKGQFDRMFGHSAKEALRIIEEELEAA